MSAKYTKLKRHIWFRNSIVMIHLTALGIAMYSKYLILWVMAIFCLSLLAYFYVLRDKHLASRQSPFRYPETTFYILSFVGGALGVLLGMNLHRHKTQHVTFKYGIPFLFIIFAILSLLIWHYR